MLDDETIRHLHSGCALLVGTVSSDGVPHAARGHGLRVLAHDPPRVRVILPFDEQLLDNLRATGLIAITSADVPTLMSLQLKGRAGPVEAPLPEDLAASERYTTAFVNDIVRIDRHPRSVVSVWAVVSEVVACDVEVLEIFDQTPGPAAGRVRRSS